MNRWPDPPTWGAVARYGLHQGAEFVVLVLATAYLKLRPRGAA